MTYLNLNYFVLWLLDYSPIVMVFFQRQLDTFGELKASSNVTENKITLQKLKFILKKIK